MNAHSTPEVKDGDTIDQGRRLVRIGDKGLSLSERLANRFHQLAWRTPLHSFRLRGRYPLKLLAVPDDPVVGHADNGKAILGGHIQLRGERIAVAGIDFSALDASEAMRDHLQSFAWLRDLSTVATRERGAPIAERVMRAWLARYADQVFESGWRVDLWGRRILYWTSHAPLILSSNDLVYRSAVLNALARGARHLDRGAERAPEGLPRMAAWAGVVAAGLLIPGGEPRRLFGEAGLTRAINGNFTADGGSIARSPLLHVEAINLLVLLNACYAARQIDPPAMIADTLARAVPALLGTVMGDGGLSSWQGGGPENPDRIAAIIAASGVRGRPQRASRDWGFQRMAAGRTVVVTDAAPPPVSRVAIGGCASTLAFEMADGPHRLVVNCGGSRARSPAIPAALADALRSTAAHSTLVIADHNSTAIMKDGTLGRGVGEVTIERQEQDSASRIEMSHDGYARRFGFVHRRLMTLSSDGRELRGEDMLLPSARRRKPGVTPFAIRFHLAPEVEASPTADGLGALLRIGAGAVWQFRCRGGLLALEESLWTDGEGRPHATQQLVVNGHAQPGGASVGWLFKKAGQA